MFRALGVSRQQHSRTELRIASAHLLWIYVREILRMKYSKIYVQQVYALIIFFHFVLRQ